MSAFDLEEAAHREAEARTGLSDFGDTGYLAGLRKLAEALADDPDNVPLRDIVHGHVRNALMGRLHSQEGWRRRPDSLRQPVRSPLIITGLPRTGTSLLHHMMALDPQFAWVPYWLATAPQPMPPRREWRARPAYAAAQARLDAQYRSNPKLRSGHSLEVEAPEECIHVMAQSLTSMRFVSTLPLPRYHAWFFEQDETPSYARYADNLRLMGADDTGRPWLLKNPSHTMGIDSLLRVFPDARLITTYRDPTEAITSGASVISMATGGTWGGRPTGPHRLKTWSRAARRLEAAMDRQPGSFFHVSYAAMIDRPIAVLKALYGQLGLVLMPETEAAVLRWLGENPQGKHGVHRYSPEDVGLTAAGIRQEFTSYNERYGFAS